MFQFGIVNLDRQRLPFGDYGIGGFGPCFLSGFDKGVAQGFGRLGHMVLHFCSTTRAIQPFGRLQGW